MTEKIHLTSWSNRLEKPKQDYQLRDELVRLRSRLVDARKHALLTPDGNNGYITDPVEAWSNGTHSPESYLLEGEARLNLKNDGVFMSMLATKDRGTTDTDPETIFYHISEGGAVLEMTNYEVVEDKETCRRLGLLMDATSRTLHDNINTRSAEKLKNKQRLIKRIGYTAGIGLSLLVTGAVVDTPIINPHIAAQEHRTVYDSEHHTLPHDSNSEAGSFSIVSNGSFADIPSYGGSDTNLTNPRKLTLKSDQIGNACASIHTDIPPGKNLIVAMPKNSPYPYDHSYTTYYRGSELHICLVGFPVIPVIDPVPVDIAIQFE